MSKTTTGGEKRERSLRNSHISAHIATELLLYLCGNFACGRRLWPVIYGLHLFTVHMYRL